MSGILRKEVGAVSTTPLSCALLLIPMMSIDFSLTRMFAGSAFLCCLLLKKKTTTKYLNLSVSVSTPAGHTSHKSDCDELRRHRHHHSILCATGRRRQVAASQPIKVSGFFFKAPVCKMLWRPTAGMQTTFTPLLDLTPVVCQLCELHKLKPLLVLIEMFIFRAPNASFTCVY